MSRRRRIPASRCSRCTHYRGAMCVLEDLEPCAYCPTADAMNERAKNIFLSVVTAAALALTALFVWLLNATQPDTDQPEAPAPAAVSVTALLRERNAQQQAAADTLTDWQLLTLAIMYTESRFRPDVVGEAQDSGILQLRPCYVREVNRVAGTDYAPEDAFDPALAVEIYETMQAVKNPAHDPDTALALHNAGPGYRARVLENLELIRRYEAARKLITTK